MVKADIQCSVLRAAGCGRQAAGGWLGAGGSDGRGGAPGPSGLLWQSWSRPSRQERARGERRAAVRASCAGGAGLSWAGWPCAVLPSPAVLTRWDGQIFVLNEAILSAPRMDRLWCKAGAGCWQEDDCAAVWRSTGEGGREAGGREGQTRAVSGSLSTACGFQLAAERLPSPHLSQSGVAPGRRAGKDEEAAPK